jgi:hypothetical protein
VHKATLIQVVLAAVAFSVAGCGPDDRTFVDGPDPGNRDSSVTDVPTGTGNDGSPDARTMDAPRVDVPAADVPPTDAPASMDATDGGADRRDATSDPSVSDAADGTSDISPDNLAPDVIADTTSEPSNDSSVDAADAAPDTADGAIDTVVDVDCGTTPVPTISPSGSTAICPGKSVTLTSSAAASYSWSTGATTQAIIATAAGSYAVTTTDTRGCMATSAPTAVTVYPGPTVPTISASGPTRFCSGSNVTLTASSAASYRWSTGATTQAIVVTDTGDYTVTTTNANGCEATSAPTSVTRVVPPPGTRTFIYTGAIDSFTVPECVTSITADVYGAQGGNGTYYLGGLGGRVLATLSVVPNSSLSIRVGGAGGGPCPAGGQPGFNGGGQGNCNAASDSGSGGGATDIRVSPFGIGNRIIVAGAGGGAGYNCGATAPDHGGAGGGLTGQTYPTLCSAGTPGGGGSQVSGGSGGTAGTSFGFAGSGGLGFGGSGTSSGGTITATEGGGGGGGYYGGGGGCYGGGGGGSSYVIPGGSSGITHWQGVRSGHGTLIINW